MLRFLLLLITFSLSARPIETFYGVVDVTEPVLLELIDSKAVQRLKSIHQYGVAYYTTHREEYTRYDHSLGVFHLLRASGCPLKEQIAGLLHDVSHTVFSHVGDHIFQVAHKETDYQNSIHEDFLNATDIGAILRKYGLSPKELLPVEHFFPALEQPRPNLCADRLEYNIQGAYHQKFITKQEALEIFNDCHFIDGNWIATKPDLMEKLVRFSLFMTEDCFGGATNHLSSTWLAEAILKGLELHLITSEEVHYGTDEAVWQKLSSSSNPFIHSRMNLIHKTKETYTFVKRDEADIYVKTKFWGFDPLIHHNGALVRLTSMRPLLAKEYQTVKDRIAEGFSIKLLTDVNASQKAS